VTGEEQFRLAPRLMQPADELNRAIEAADHIYVACHRDPDGDAIGSLLAFVGVLRAAGKAVTGACEDPVPEMYQFLPGSSSISPAPPADEDLIISLDVGSPDRLGVLYEPGLFGAVRLVNIDHHITNTGFGDINIVDAEAAATSEILYLLFQYLGYPILPDIATCLATGIVTDTRSFRTSNTTPRALQVAAALIELGAPLTDIALQVYEHKPVAALYLLGEVLQAMRALDGIIWSEVTQGMMRRSGARPEHASSIINLLNSTRDADIAVLFFEGANGTVDVGFRSKPGVNVADIAVTLGGGGHPQASGCQLAGPLPEVREKVLHTVRSMLGRPAAAGA
jgi:phosphoesterase RecJ-like protein